MDLLFSMFVLVSSVFYTFIVDLMESEEKGLVVHEVNNTTEYKNTAFFALIHISSISCVILHGSAVPPNAIFVFQWSDFL